MERRINLHLNKMENALKELELQIKKYHMMEISLYKDDTLLNTDNSPTQTSLFQSDSFIQDESLLMINNKASFLDASTIYYPSLNDSPNKTNLSYPTVFALQSCLKQSSQLSELLKNIEQAVGTDLLNMISYEKYKPSNSFMNFQPELESKLKFEPILSYENRYLAGEMNTMMSIYDQFSIASKDYLKKYHLFPEKRK